MPDITRKDMIREIDRELGQRCGVYPRLIDAGKLTQAKADRQVAVLQAARAEIVKLDEADEQRGKLL